MSDAILLERDGALATLTLNRPGALNALDLAMMNELVGAAAVLASDAGVRCVFVRGAGRHFMAGGDLRTFAAQLGASPAQRQAEFTRMVQGVHAAIEHLQRVPAPVIASVQGAVAGFGLSLVGACDLGIAADDAYFAAAYRNIGLTPDGGGSYWLPRLVGMKRAMEILLLGERFDAAEALRLGLVNRVVPAAELASTTRAVAQAMLDGPALALASTKRLLWRSLHNSLSEQLQAEAISFGRCAGTADFVEGIEAFLAKRAPSFGEKERPQD
jgi:2-(1,2-epoxy-1,2-dihydrophenyl)acetyl-CoA isomerase